MWTLFALACALHVGRPAPAAAGFSISRIAAPSIEPGLRDDLAAALGRALASRGALGNEGLAVDVEVLEADTSTAASGGGAQVRVARLSIAVAVMGPRPRRVVLAGERGYTVLSGASLEASDARSQAFAALAASLAEDAADWMLYAP